MGFRLLVECSKDISLLNINFSDGTSSVVESPDVAQDRNESFTIKESTQSTQLTTSTTPELPEVPDQQRDASVAPELQNLDI